ncbi:MAG: hypothetical protein WCP77_09930 [Roseococcus sp.]
MISRSDQRHLDDIIRRAMHSVMREYLAPLVETEEFRVRLASAIAARCVAAGVPKPRIERPIEPITAPSPAASWTVGEGSRRRLTEAGLARLAALLPEKTDTEIAAELGITRRAVETRRKTGTESTAAWAGTPQPERDLARAEKNREYQREWYRKRRAKTDAPAAVEPVAVGVDLSSGPDVQVEMAVTVPALIVPPAPAIVLPAPAAPAKLILPAAPPPKPTPQDITTTPKDVRGWLIASMKAGGLTLVQAQDRVAYMTHDQALAEANQRRARAGHPPFAFIGSRSAA